MRRMLALAALSLSLWLALPAQAQDARALWLGAISQWGRPASFYKLVHAEDPATCIAYARAAAEPLGATMRDELDDLAVITASVPWRYFEDRRLWIGYHRRNWAIVDLANAGHEHAVLFVRWKGHGHLYVLPPDPREDALAMLNDLLYVGAADPRDVLKDLRLASQLDSTAQRLLGRRLYEETTFRHYSIVRLRGRHYVSALLWQESRGPASLRPALLLIALDAQFAARLVCVLLGGSVIP